jgi:hypothetical protein
MAKTSWQIRGDYFETCSCDFVCPCVPSNFAARPTKGDCYFALVFHIDDGRYGKVALNGLAFAVVARTPDVMGQGNWSVGLIVDDRASAEQRDAITGIASGQAGGPMAALGPLIGNFLGVETRPIHFEKDGLRRSVSIPDMLDQAMQAVESPVKPGEPIYVDNTGHPASPWLALGMGTRSHLHAFGMSWDDTSGKNNAHLAPFKWKG